MRNLNSLAEFAALSSRINSETFSVEDFPAQLSAAIIDRLSPIYQDANRFADCYDKAPVADPALGYCVDAVTRADVDLLCKDVFEHVRKRLEADTGSGAGGITFGFVGSVDPRSMPAVSLAAIIRSNKVTTCQINGQKISSKSPLTAKLSLTMDYHVHVNSTEESAIRIGVAFSLSVAAIRIRAGYPAADWERLQRVGTQARFGSAETFGCQYQGYEFTQVNSYAFGYTSPSDRPFDYDECRLPSMQTTMDAQLSGWTLTLPEGV